MPPRGHSGWISVTFFLVAATPGCWLPVLANLMKAQGWAHLITWAFLTPPLASMISPLVLAARADQKVAAERLLFWLVLSGTPFLWMAFAELERGDRPGWFLFHLAVNSLITAPVWPLLTGVALTSLRDREHRFGLYRVWGTVGWMTAGWLVSALALDGSPACGKLATGIRVLATGACLLLPHTPPRAKPAKNWRELLGLSSFSLLKDRDIGVFMLTTFLFSIPLAAFYMHSSLQLEALGHRQVAAGMTLGQVSEVGAMLLMGVLLRRWRVKWLFLFAIGCGLARYLLYAVGASSGGSWWVLSGIAFHGLCWTFFFEAGRLFLDRRVEPEMRSQIQALLSLMSSGVGSVAGTFLVGRLHTVWVVDGHGSWSGYWLFLAAMCAACALLFVFGYQGASVTRAQTSWKT
jgi:MFS family permease